MSQDQQAIETLLNIAEQYAGHGKNITQQGAGAVKGAHGDSALTTAEADLKVCFWSFSWNSAANFGTDIARALRQLYFSSWFDWINQQRLSRCW